jgi:hypothetical protein
MGGVHGVQHSFRHGSRRGAVDRMQSPHWLGSIELTWRMYAIYWGRGACLSKISSLVITDNALQQNVAGVHETEDMKGMHS